MSQSTSHPASLSTLPPELHALITIHLPYPDALALKHSSRHFYHLVPGAGGTSIPSKVSWLLSRHERGLPCPGRSCYFKTDGLFCLGAEGEVRSLMARRRRHRECARRGVEGGCEVLVGRTCAGGEGKGRLRERLVGGWVGMGMVGWVREARRDVALWWLMVGLVVAMLANLWVGLGKGNVLGLVVAGEGGVWSFG